jgi:hypothetical protein
LCARRAGGVRTKAEVQNQPPVQLFPADSTGASVLRQHLVVVLQRYPIGLLEGSLALVLGVGSDHLRLVFRIGGISFPPLRIDPVLVTGLVNGDSRYRITRDSLDARLTVGENMRRSVLAPAPSQVGPARHARDHAKPGQARVSWGGEHTEQAAPPCINLIETRANWRRAPQ